MKKTQLYYFFHIFIILVFSVFIFPFNYGCSSEDYNINETQYESTSVFKKVSNHIKEKGVYSYDTKLYRLTVYEDNCIFMLAYQESTDIMSLNVRYSEKSDSVTLVIQIKNTNGIYPWTTIYGNYTMSGEIYASNFAERSGLNITSYPKSYEYTILNATYTLANIAVKCFSGILYYDVKGVTIKDFGFSSKYNVV